MIHQSILSPQGCGKLLQGMCKTVSPEPFEGNCGDIIREALILCPQCKKIRQAQIQILIDEKKYYLRTIINEEEYLTWIFGYMCLAKTPDNYYSVTKGRLSFTKLEHKQVQEEIKTLEGLRE